LWRRGDQDQHCRHWQRISGHLLAGVPVRDAIHAAAVRVAAFREEFRGDVRRLFDCFWGAPRQAGGRYILPSGEWVQPEGQCRDDAVLAWTVEPGATLDAGRVAELWPGKEACLQLGPNLVLVLGIDPPAPPP